MELADAVAGRRYCVKWTDCCAQGRFEAVLERKNYVPDPPEPEPFLESVTFANGVTISGIAVRLEEAPSPAGVAAAERGVGSGPADGPGDVPAG